MIAAFEDKQDAVRYASELTEQVIKGKDEFLCINKTSDGCFFIKREAITGVRVIPDFGVRDDDDDDDDSDGDLDDDPVAPISQADFDYMWSSDS